MINVKSAAAQFLSFQLADEIYGFNVSTVREVLEYRTITKIPCLADYLVGIVNVRDQVVQIVDLRKKFDIETKEKKDDSNIIVVEIKHDDALLHVGILVDAVREVLDIDDENIEDPPKIGLADVRKSVITGIGETGETFILLLDLQNLFSTMDLANISGNNKSEILISPKEKGIKNETK